MMRNLLRSLVAVSLVVAGVGLPAGASSAAGKPWRCGASGGVGQRTVVLLVHGFNSEPETWSDVTEHYLASNRATCISTFNYKPTSTKWVKDRTIAHDLGATIKALASSSRDGHGSGKVVIVGHSMGGLAARCAATPDCSKQDGVASDIQALITFGTPTLGSFLRDDGRSHVGNILGSLLSATCSVSGLDTSRLEGLCRQVRALGTSDAAKAFTPGSDQLRDVPVKMPFPITAVAGSVKLQTSFFGHMRVLTGDAGDLVVDVQSALEANSTVDGIGGKHVVDCGDLDITGIGAGVYGVPAVAAAAAYGAAFSSLRCLHTSETNDSSFLLFALHEITQIENAPLAAANASSRTAATLEELLRSAGLWTTISSKSACTEVDVQGTAFDAEAADIVVSHTSTGSCQGPFATFFKIRAGIVAAHADECDCDKQSAEWTRLQAPYLKRSPSVFHVESGRLTPGALSSVSSEYSSLSAFAHIWVGYPSAMGSADFFSIDADGTAKLDTSDGAHVVVSVTATGPGSASGVVTSSTSPYFRAGLILTLRRGKGVDTGLVVVGSSSLPRHWCTTGIGTCGAG